MDKSFAAAHHVALKTAQEEQSMIFRLNMNRVLLACVLLTGATTALLGAEDSLVPFKVHDNSSPAVWSYPNYVYHDKWDLKTSLVMHYRDEANGQMDMSHPYYFRISINEYGLNTNRVYRTLDESMTDNDLRRVCVLYKFIRPTGTRKIIEIGSKVPVALLKAVLSIPDDLTNYDVFVNHTWGNNQTITVHRRVVAKWCQRVPTNVLERLKSGTMKMSEFSNLFDKDETQNYPTNDLSLKLRSETGAKRQIRPPASDDMVLIRGGSFLFGYNTFEPVKQVDLGDFYIGKFEVTVGEFRKFVEDTTYVTSAERQGWAIVQSDGEWSNVKDANWKNPGFEQTDRHPVVCLTWSDAAEYCNWRSRKENRKPCYAESGQKWTIDETAGGYRMPTEAEWEYACCGGKEIKSGTDSSDNDLAQIGWYVGNSAGKSHPVGQKTPNTFGLYDMCGNAGEWCQDWDKWNGDEKKYWTELGWNLRYTRGGSWAGEPKMCTPRVRAGVDPASATSTIGFRIVVR